MIIPHQQVSADALNGLMEEFITREGTDYGFEETSLERKVEQVRGQIERGEVVIVFDPATETVSLLPRREADQIDWREPQDSQDPQDWPEAQSPQTPRDSRKPQK